MQIEFRPFSVARSTGQPRDLGVRIRARSSRSRQQPSVIARACTVESNLSHSVRRNSALHLRSVSIKVSAVRRRRRWRPAVALLMRERARRKVGEPRRCQVKERRRREKREYKRAGEALTRERAYD